MTPAAVALLVLALAAAVADWAAVAVADRRPAPPTDRRTAPAAVAATERRRPALPARVRWLTKPLPLVLLIVAALALVPADPAVRAFFVVGLACSLAGDIALLRPRRFVAGLAAFLLAHVAYTAGFVVGGQSVPAFALAAAAMLAFDLVVGGRLVRALRAHPTGGRAGLVGPVVAYMAAISAMVATAAGSLDPVALAGAALFAASDTLLAEERFIRRVRGGDLAVMVLYHVGQGLLVLSLALPAR